MHVLGYGPLETNYNFHRKQTQERGFWEYFCDKLKQLTLGTKALIASGDQKGTKEIT